MRRLTFRTIGLALSAFEAYGCRTCLGSVLLFILVVVALVALCAYLLGLEHLSLLLSDLQGY